MPPTKTRLPIQDLEKIEPWGRRCRCGAVMKVYPVEGRSALVDQEAWRRIAAESGHDYTRAGQVLEASACDWYGFHVLGHRCLACGCRSTDWDARFTAEEAAEVAASQNTAQGTPVTGAALPAA